MDALADDALVLLALELLREQGWRGTDRKCGHSVGSAEKLFCIKDAFKHRFCYRALLRLPEIHSRGVARFQSAMVQSYFKLLLKGVVAPQGWPHVC